MDDWIVLLLGALDVLTPAVVGTGTQALEPGPCVKNPELHDVQPVDPAAGENVLFGQGVHTVLMVLSSTGRVPAGHSVQALDPSAA